HCSPPFLDADSLFPFLQPPHPFLEMSGLSFRGMPLEYKKHGYLLPHMSIRCLGVRGHKNLGKSLDSQAATCLEKFPFLSFSRSVSAHRQTVSTPQALSSNWASETADCVDTLADRVDTTGYCFRTYFWDSHLVSIPQVDCVDTTGESLSYSEMSGAKTWEEMRPEWYSLKINRKKEGILPCFADILPICLANISKAWEPASESNTKECSFGRRTGESTLRTGRISPVDMSGNGYNGEEGTSLKVIRKISVKDTVSMRFFWNEGDRRRRSRRMEEMFGIEGCRWVNWSSFSER
ncbi:hypothetical protein Taro_050971, partial [Colocasia esculenta]|nr:hypothetical protein [Colocasia esculenta]